MENQKSYINKKTISAFFLGVFLVVFLYQLYIVLVLMAEVNVLRLEVDAIINFLEGPQVEQVTEGQ